ITSMMDLLSTHLKPITIKKKMIAKIKCTVILLRRFIFSSQSERRFMPSRSIQNEDVSAVNAPSALGKRAEIRPITKMIGITFPIKCKATVGKRSSGGVLIPFVDENK